MTLMNPQITIERCEDYKYAVYRNEKHIADIDTRLLIADAEVVDVDEMRYIRFHTLEDGYTDIPIDSLIEQEESPKRIFYSSHCQSCGAPIDNDNTKCEYCGTPYYG